MGRQLGSKNKPKNDVGIGHNSGAVDGAVLRGYIERIEQLNEDIVNLKSDRADIFRELKANGYDAATMRVIIKRRAMDAEKRTEADALLNQYLVALGYFVSSPLDAAEADRLREMAAHVTVEP
jgi:uncharacterized protein (UPF0335 family)